MGEVASKNEPLDISQKETNDSSIPELSTEKAVEVGKAETIDTKKKRSKVHEWNKRAGAQIQALGENVDEASRKIVKSLQKSRDSSKHRAAKSKDQSITEPTVLAGAVSGESSDISQNETQDGSVPELSTEKSAEVEKAETQTDDAEKLEVVLRNEPSDISQKEINDSSVSELSTEKAAEVGKAETQTDDAEQLEVASKNEPSDISQKETNDSSVPELSTEKTVE